MADQIITAHQGRRTWQGYASDAPVWVLDAVAAAAGQPNVKAESEKPA